MNSHKSSGEFTSRPDFMRIHGVLNSYENIKKTASQDQGSCTIAAQLLNEIFERRVEMSNVE